MNQVFEQNFEFQLNRLYNMHVEHLIKIPPSCWVIVTCTTGFSWREVWSQA